MDRDAVGSCLVLLKLMVGYVEMLGKVRLRFACGNTREADRASQIAIEMIFWTAFAKLGHVLKAALGLDHDD